MDKIPNLPDEEWRPIEGYKGKYLISNCGRVKSLKHANARLLKVFANNKGYEKKIKRVKVFDMVMGTEYDVKMRFNNGLASAVIDKFGKDIMMIPDGEDCFITTQTIDVNAAFFAWMAMFGGGAEIISPEKVVERMKRFINNAAKVYKNDGEM